MQGHKGGEGRELASVSRPAGCIHAHTYSSEVSEVPKIHWTNIAIQGTTFWPSVSTASIHKSNATHSGSSQRRRNIGIFLSRRLDPKIPTKNNITTYVDKVTGNMGLVRTDKKHTKITHRSNSKFSFVGGHFQTQTNVMSLPEERLESLKEGLRPFKAGTVVTARHYWELWQQ